MLLVVALKPIADVFDPSANEDVFGPGTAVTLLLLGIAVLVALSSRRVKFGPFLVILAVAVPVAVGFLHGTVGGLAVPPIVDSLKVATGFAPLVLLTFLPSTELRNLSGEPFTRFFKLLLLAAGVHIAIAILQFLGVAEFTYTQSSGGTTIGRPSGGYFHPVSLGLLLNFVVIFAWIRYRSGQQAGWQYASIVLLCIMTTVLSTHRTSLAALGLVLLVLEVLPRVLMYRSRVSRFYPAALGGIVLLLLVVIILPGVAGGLSAAVQRVTVVLTEGDFNPASEEFLRGRGEQWRAAIQSMSEPGSGRWLLGFGHEVVDPHNDLLRMFLVSGAAGVAAFGFAFCVLFLWSLVRLDRRGRILVLALGSYMTIFSITFKPTSYPYYMWLFCLAITFALVFFRREQYSLS